MYWASQNTWWELYFSSKASIRSTDAYTSPRSSSKQSLFPRTKIYLENPQQEAAGINYPDSQSFRTTVNYYYN